jgi:membrane protein YqaA with SNARE-associated domain
MPTKGSLSKAILLLICILIVAGGLSLLLRHFFTEEDLRQFAEYGYLGVFLVTLISSLSILLPLPGTVVVLAAADIWNPALIALVAGIGGALGEISAYMLGYGGRAVIAPEQSKRYKQAEGWMKRRGGFAIFLFALIPFLIFDFMGIAAGVFRYPLRKFLFFTLLGRLPRSFIEVYVYLWFGVPLLEWILEHLPF